MNCRRTRELLSPYSDGRLTGVQMLEVAQHMDHCPGCREEYHVIKEVKVLLRAVSRPQPGGLLEHEIRKRIATEEAISQINLCLSFSVRPQRAKRMATAMALSCISVLVVAAPFGAGTLALSYSRLSGKPAPSAVASRPDPRSLLDIPGVPSGGFFASSGVAMVDTPQYGPTDRRSQSRDDYAFMTSRSQGYSPFASRAFSDFGGYASFYVPTGR